MTNAVGLSLAVLLILGSLLLTGAGIVGIVYLALRARDLVRSAGNPRVRETPRSFLLAREAPLGGWSGSAGRSLRCQTFDSGYDGIVSATNQHASLRATVERAQRWLRAHAGELTLRSVDLAMSSSTAHTCLWYEEGGGDEELHVELIQRCYTGLIGRPNIQACRAQVMTLTSEWIAAQGEDIEVRFVSSAQSRSATAVAVWYVRTAKRLPVRLRTPAVKLG